MVDDDSAPRETMDGKTPAGDAVQNVDQLRDAIDRGATGEKVDHADPAAAPLGTDDEAAGFSPARRQVEIAARHEVRSRETRQPVVTWRRAGIVVAILALASVVTFAMKTRS